MSLDKALDKMNKAYGKGTVNRVKDMEMEGVDFISTGSLALDIALGGGFPKGRIVEIFGPESSGKTTATLHAIAEVQKEGGIAAFVDNEHALDPTYATAIGVDMDELVFSQPDSAEQTIDIIDALVRSGEVDLIVVDSVAAMTPKKELEGESGDAVVGVLARLMAQAMRKVVGAAKKNDCTIIFINQLREKIGVMFGSPETTPGGNALKFACSQRVDVRRKGSNKEGNVAVSNNVKFTIKKNKVAPPFKEAETVIEFGKGFIKEAEVLLIGAEMDILEKSGAWYSYEGTKLGCGRDACVEILQDNPELTDEIQAKIMEQLKTNK